MLNEIAGYRLIKLIGTNGSEVWLAEKNGEKYAIKIPRANLIKTFRKEELEGFLEKAKMWKKLCEKHENIVEVREYDIKPLPFIVMEYCETNLRKILKEKGKLSIEECEKIALKIAEALDVAHHYGVVHRDIKPENILFREGKPKIGDWGIAKILLKATTRTGYTGTPLYSAPEQLDPDTFGEVDWRTDIWQLGCLIYEMIIGKPPFQAEHPSQLIWKILNEEPEPIKVVPQWLKEVILGCLRKRKEERWQSVSIILEMLRKKEIPLKINKGLSTSKEISSIKVDAYCAEAGKKVKKIIITPLEVTELKCEKCGKTLYVVSENKVICPNCMAPLTVYTAYCKKCNKCGSKSIEWYNGWFYQGYRCTYCGSHEYHETVDYYSLYCAKCNRSFIKSYSAIMPIQEEKIEKHQYMCTSCGSTSFSQKKVKLNAFLIKCLYCGKTGFVAGSQILDVFEADCSSCKRTTDWLETETDLICLSCMTVKKKR